LLTLSLISSKVFVFSSGDIRSHHLAIALGANLLHSYAALVFDAGTLLSYIALNADT
jgi:hypothetical protein